MTRPRAGRMPSHPAAFWKAGHGSALPPAAARQLIAAAYGVVKCVLLPNVPLDTKHKSCYFQARWRGPAYVDLPGTAPASGE